MPRITERDLDGVCETIRKETGDATYSIGYTDGVPRLYRDNEAREVSPRLPKPALYDWLWAYLDGIREGYNIAYIEYLHNGRVSAGRDD